MSGIVNWADELEGYGLNSGPDVNVCSAHFKDLAIKSFIKKGTEKNECDYCGKTRVIRPLEDIMKFLMETVSYYFTDPVEFASYNSAEGGYLVPHRDAWEILQEDFELDIDETALFNDMEEWVDFSKHWADEKELYSEGHYARPDSWSHFCYLVKHQIRYLFPAYQNELDTYSHRPLEILKEIERMIYRYNLLTTLNAGTELVRCRQHHKSEIISDYEQMCAPETTHCKNPNRMSPAGISMFYCAFEVETTLKETIDKLWKQSKYTTVTFALKEDILVVDLSKLPASPSVFDQSKRKKFADVIFLKNFIHDLSKPIDRDGKVHIDYVPTQIVTEFFRYMFKKKVTGIIYPSSRNAAHNAMVLFYDHYDCRQQLDFLPHTLQTKPISSYKL